MNTSDILTHLSPHKLEHGSDRNLSLSSGLVRCEALGLVAIGSDKDEDDHTNALVDGLYWHRHVMKGQGPLTLMLGRAPFTPKVLQTIGTMMAVIGDKVAIHIRLDGQEVNPVRPDFGGAKSDWMSLLNTRDVAIERPPNLVIQLHQLVKAP